MSPKAKSEKKISRRRTVKREVDIPVFVVGGKKFRDAVQEEQSARSFSGEGLKIVRGEDDLPVVEHSVFVPKEEEMVDNLKKSKKQVRPEESPNPVPASRNAVLKHGAFLSEGRKKTIMFVSVVVLASAIFFIWLIGLKNNFSGMLGLASYTFSRNAGGVLEEAGAGIDKLGDGLSNLEDALIREARESADEAVVDKLKEKILVEELKSKLDN
jgi:hypothetical protein